MTTFQSVTKQDIREINTGFSLFCTEEKSKSNSTSPMKARKVFKAKRRNGNNNNQQIINNNNNNNNNNKYDKFAKMSDSEYVEYQKETMPKRMQRKRKFDQFSSGSNSSLHEILENSNTFRIPYHSMFYVRVDNENNSQLNQIENNKNKNKNKNTNNKNNKKNNKNEIKKKPKCAFKMLLNGSKAINDWKVAESQLNINDDNDDDDDDSNNMDIDDNNDGGSGGDNDLCSKIISENNGSNIFYPVFEECLITRSVRVSSEWVTAYNNFDFADNMAWKQFNCDGKIHEYQINRSHGIILLNLDETKNEQNNNDKNQNLKNNFLKQNENDIKQWVLDHGYSGFISDSCFYLFQPHLFWNLLDDNKRSKIKQTLISDIFQSTKTKPTQNTFRFHTTF